MENVSFVKNQEEIRNFNKLLQESKETQEGLMFVWKTDPEILEKIIPCPLKITGPYVFACVSYIYEADFWKDYNESFLLVPVTYNGEEYSYFLSMSIAGKNDMPVYLGREHLGFPKKIADALNIYRSGDNIKVSVKRNGITYLQAEAQVGRFNSPDAEVIFDQYKPGARLTGNGVNLKYDIDCSKSKVGFTDVRLVTSESTSIYSSVDKARITRLDLTPSRDDPWSELKVLQPVGAIYFKCDCIMGPSKDLIKLDEEAYAKYLLAKYDSSAYGYAYRNFNITK